MQYNENLQSARVNKINGIRSAGWLWTMLQSATIGWEKKCGL